MENRGEPTSVTPSRTHSHVLVVDSGGRITFASGVLSAPRTATAAIRAWQQRLPGQSLLNVRNDDMTLSVLGIETDDGCVFISFSDQSNAVLINFVTSVPFAADILRHILTNPYEAMTVVDAAGVVRYVSPVHEQFFGLGAGSGTGKHVTDVIENTRLHEVVRHGKAEIGQVQEMRGIARVVTRVPIRDHDGEIVGAIGQVMFRGPEHLQALSAEISRLRSEVAFYRREISTLRNRSSGLDLLIGQSSAMQKLKADIAKVADLDVPILLAGESGTGKEVVAHAIHLLSSRRDKRMVLVNAAALPSTLVESELFGYESGAFTGAERKGRKGKFEMAHESTLFLDEIGDMPLEVQVKLLRVLQDGMIERVGGDRARLSEFRLICASNRDLLSMIDAHQFRLDLYYRISAVTLHLPPLRARRDDIPLLAEHCLGQFETRHRSEAKRVSKAAMDYLQAQSWPGNVRQLFHVLERGAIFASGSAIEIEDFGTIPSESDVGTIFALPTRETPGLAQEAAQRSQTVKIAITDLEAQLIREAMLKFRGNKAKVAQELGISRSYLYKRLGQVDIS